MRPQDCSICITGGPVYQYALSINDGKPTYEHEENLLTAQCLRALNSKAVLKHGACPYAASATLTLSAQSKEYDGKPVVATLTASEGWELQKPFEYDASQITYYMKDGTLLQGAPKDVGDYVAQFKLDGDASTNPGEGQTKYSFISTSFSITPRNNPPTPPEPEPDPEPEPSATNNDVAYSVHCQTYGWKAPSGSNGALAGTTGKGKRLEAVRIRLTGDVAKHFSVWYRVHSQTYGWLGWACDGADAGTVGLAKRAEAIEVQVLPQGTVPSGYDAGVAACRTR